jgi:hypothetical protein
MKGKSARILLALGVLAAGLGASTRAAASLDTLLLDQEGQFTENEAWTLDRPSRQRWELMLAPGYSFLVGPHYGGVDYSNGWAGDAGLYYDLGSWLQLGVEGGYSFKHDHDDKLYTLYWYGASYDVVLEHRLEIAHIEPVFRLGRWLRGPEDLRWRPYVQAGVGWYELITRVDEQIPANQFLASDQLSEQTNQYLGAQAGAGMEVEVYPQSVIGVQLTYHRVFSSPDNIEMFTPSLRFSYLF